MNEKLDDLIESLREPVANINRIQKVRLENVKKKINTIISNNVMNNNIVESTFDELIDLLYWYGESIKDSYFELLNYYKKLNVKNSEEYEDIYYDIINDDGEENK